MRQPHLSSLLDCGQGWGGGGQERAGERTASKAASVLMFPKAHQLTRTSRQLGISQLARQAGRQAGEAGALSRGLLYAPNPRLSARAGGLAEPSWLASSHSSCRPPGSCNDDE